MNIFTILAMTQADLVLLVEARDAARTGDGAALRESVGLSRGDLARAANLSEVTVWRYEHGRSSPRGDAALRYARALRRLQAIADGRSP